MATLFPDQSLDQSSPEYEKALQTFWNRRQQENRPQGYFKPTRASQVQAAIKEVVKAQSPFAIRGGGHSSNSIGSSSQGGFLFDLSDLNHIEVADDRKSIRLGPGVHWGPLYQVLEPQGLICLGGRDFGVGVPGFIFGGMRSGMFFTTYRPILMGWCTRRSFLFHFQLRLGSRQYIVCRHSSGRWLSDNC